MLMLMIAVFFACVAALDDCDVSREEVINCLFDKVDFDKSGDLTEMEAQFVYQTVLSTFTRFVAYRLISPSAAIAQCGGARVTRQEVIDHEDLCLPTCRGRSSIMSDVCERLNVVSEDLDIQMRYEIFVKRNGGK